MATEGNTTNHKKIWDDTALVDSWNEALDEYKVWLTPLASATMVADAKTGQTYHSVHARGGSVKDIQKDDSSM